MRGIATALLAALIVACSAGAPMPTNLPTAMASPTAVPRAAPAPTPPVPAATVATSASGVSSSATAVLARGEGPATYAFADADHGWVLAGRTILATADGGGSWHALPLSPPEIASLALVSPTEGWAGTTHGLFRTRDGGVTWARVPVGESSDTPVYVAGFVDARHGWVRVGGPDQANLMRTVDAGAAWVDATDPCGGPADALARAFSFVSAQHGWVMCGGAAGTGYEYKTLYHTTDGGTNWAQISQVESLEAQIPRLPAFGYVASLAFRDDAHGWLSLAWGQLLATDDGGLTWRFIPGPFAPDQQWYYGKVARPSAAVGYLTVHYADCSGLFRTADTAATWAQIYPAPPTCPGAPAPLASATARR